MNILLLGCGKTGSQVAEVGRERGHQVEILRAADNPKASALTKDRLKNVAVVIDFTNPQVVEEHIHACARAGTCMVVGTTGWHGKLASIKKEVEKHGAGLLYAANFSVGVNLFIEAARSAAEALRHRYSGQIFERHHAEKKDAPSGTALALQKAISEHTGTELEITSFREGEVVGLHELILQSPNDRIYLCHDAKSRRGYAEGAVRAAEWLVGKKGVFDFRDVWKEI